MFNDSILFQMDWLSMFLEKMKLLKAIYMVLPMTIHYLFRIHLCLLLYPVHERNARVLHIQSIPPTKVNSLLLDKEMRLCL